MRYQGNSNDPYVPKLIPNYTSGEGKIKFPKIWYEWDALTRADLLKDWIYDLTVEYDKTVSQFKELFSPEILEKNK